ncbi:hypothetical protein GIB67_013299 [Kingdonia uniflora]|uniref:Uncharacterized protein n=1 Tax=Kingdonia uniflora TaxID=39325 RepID=A0A7J7LQX6_9MAGN|nr:hypothetical protein GIB67_013299 [Kingdonia uniflora]
MQIQDNYGASGYFLEIGGTNKRKHVETLKLTEVSASDKLQSFRASKETVKVVSWTLIRHLDQESNIPINTLLKRTEFNSKLVVVLSMMDECFMPTFDRQSDRTLTGSITVASTPQFWRGVMKPSLQHPSVCRDTKLALDGDEKMGNMVAHDVQDITKEDGEIIEAVEQSKVDIIVPAQKITEQAKDVQAHQAGLMEQKAQEGSVNVVNSDLPTSEDDTDTGYVPDLDRGFYSDIEHYISVWATPVKKPRVTSRRTITVNGIIRI